MQRRNFERIDPIDERLSEEAKRLRKQAQGTPPGIEREKLLRRARQAENERMVEFSKLKAAYLRTRAARELGFSANTRARPLGVG